MRRTITLTINEDGLKDIKAPSYKGAESKLLLDIIDAAMCLLSIEGYGVNNVYGAAIEVQLSMARNLVEECQEPNGGDEDGKAQI